MSKANVDENSEETTIPTISEESSSLGDIKINLNVVASIVRLAALNVSGVVSVGGGIGDAIAEIFSAKDSGVRVTHDEAGAYKIEVRVVLKFGVELAEVAYLVQQSVKEQVAKMTHNDVARVDVIVDGVKMDQPKKERDPHTEAHPVD